MSAFSNSYSTSLTDGTLWRARRGDQRECQTLRHELLRGGRLVELFPEWSDERFPLYAVYPSRLHRTAKVRAFIEFCLKIMGGNQNAAPGKAQ